MHAATCVAVKRQPWISVLNFYLVFKTESHAVSYCLCQPSCSLSFWGVSCLYPPSRQSNIGVTDTWYLPRYAGIMGIWTHILTLVWSLLVYFTHSTILPALKVLCVLERDKPLCVGTRQHYASLPGNCRAFSISGPSAYQIVKMHLPGTVVMTTKIVLF